jgi:glycosyltransferase involved in cell wall biosynthesis
MFIARAYPPTVGGMENLAFQLREHLAEFVDVVPLINRRGKKALPFFLPYAVLAAARLARSGRIDAVHLADALLAPAGAVVKAITGVPVTASVCGLDVTYPHRAYQAMIHQSLPRLDMTMPISSATEHAMRVRIGGRLESRIIPLGVNPLPAPDAAAQDQLERVAGSLGDRRVLLTVGRLIERKGVAWFVEHVMARLPGDVVYVVVGEGPERAAILRAASAAGVADRVRMTGELSDRAVAAAYTRADVFAMPNVPVAGDMEGFGLVALEAAATGVPVIASALEGITEAVHHGRNGMLVSPLDAAASADAIRRILNMAPRDRRELGARFARYTAQEFGWRKTAARYSEAIASTVHSPRAAVRNAA